MSALVNPKNRCLFCLSDLKRRGKGLGQAEEHVVPKWLSKYLGIQKTRITPMRVGTHSGEIIDFRQQTVGTLVAGGVCANCNNGWMSKLETDTKPILKALISNVSRLTTLTVEQRYLLARWTLKTVGVLNRCSTYGDPNDSDARPVPDGHLEAVRYGQLPDRVIVLASGYPSVKVFDWLQFSTWATPMSSAGLSAEDRNHSYKIAIAFKDLVLAAVHYPAPEYTYSAVEGCHFPVWTGDQGLMLIEDPGLSAPMVSNSPALETFLRNVYVVSNAWLALAFRA